MEIYFKYWGKAERDWPRYHLLPYHCLDVAAVGWVALAPEKPLCQRLAVYLGITPETLQRLMSFFLSEHDLGKFAVAFQGLKPELSPLLVSPNKRKQYQERHDSLGFLLWFDEGGLRERLESEELQEFFVTGGMSRELRWNLDTWMEIVTGHHGIPPKRSGQNRSNNFDPQDEEAAFQYLCTAAKLFLLPGDIESLNGKEFSRRLKRLSWVLAGLVVLADWLGSSRLPDTFCWSAMPLEEYWHKHALPFAAQAVHDARLESASVAPYVNTRHLFNFVSTLTPLQQWAEQVELSPRNQLLILEDVTGAGKTEAALTLAHRLMARGLADGLYVALPTMATSNNMYRRLSEAYRRLYVDDTLPSLVLAHGARHLSKAFRASLDLPEAQGTQQRYDHDEESLEAYCSAWLADSRKKAFLADVGVGTLDQALLVVLPAKYQSLRCLGLHRKILIADEVHCFDPYMYKLLCSLLEYHASQGGSAILLSATLPYDMRRKYVEAFCTGADIEKPTLAETSYPLATHFPAPEKIETTLATRREVERTVSVVLLDDLEEVMNRIREAVEQGKCVCWVRNTVGDAVKAYRKLARQTWLDTERLMLFHSRFAMIDRQRIESATMDCFGKKSTAEMRRGRVLIATQVVEQSLDLDFDVMISDLAPIDLLIQRLGREHRHVRDAAGNRLEQEGAVDGREAPIFYLFGPAVSETPEENWLKAALPGTQKVYDNVGQLWLTQRLLAGMGKVSMPDDARVLIEGVYGLDAQATIPDALQGLSGKAEAEDLAEQSVARMNVLKFAKGYTRESAEDSGGWADETRIPTRLGNDTVRIALVVTDGDGWRPYASDSDFPWDFSMVNVPENSWLKAREQIPALIKASLDTFRGEVKALKWVEPFPMTAELSAWYDRSMGWGIPKEEANEPD